MDEPLSNLDARLRVRMRTEIAGLQRELGVTTVYVTHDQIEAMTMADRVAVLRRGVLQQLDTPQQVYAEPANLFVASFIGSPAMNLLEGELRNEDGLKCWIGAYRVDLPERLRDGSGALARAVGRTVAVGIRPDAISVAPRGAGGLAGTVTAAEELGSEVIVHVEVNATPITHDAVLDGLVDQMSTPSAARINADERRTTVVARLPADTTVGRGAAVTVGVDPAKLHFFDLEDGRALGRSASGSRARVSDLAVGSEREETQRVSVEP